MAFHCTIGAIPSKTNGLVLGWSSLHGGIGDVDLFCPVRAMSHNICSTVKYLLPLRCIMFLVLNLVCLCFNVAECNLRAISAQSEISCIFNADDYLKSPQVALIAGGGRLMGNGD